MIRLAGCEDGGCPGIWLDGDQVLAQGTAVTDPHILNQTRPAGDETLITLPKSVLGQAMATAMTRLLT